MAIQHPSEAPDILSARLARDKEREAQAAVSRDDIRKRLHLRCLELALQSQSQNPGELLSTEALIARSEAILAFVTKPRAEDIKQQA